MKDSKQMAELILNPIRMRIIQHLVISRECTIGQLSKELTDIPKPTLYRHVKVLLEGDLLMIASETPVRGAIEKTYCLNPRPFEDMDENGAASQLIHSSLMKIMEEFTAYFGGGNPEPIKDKLFLSTGIMFLGEEEFNEFMEDYGKLINRFASNKPKAGREQRKLTLISSPVMGKRREIPLQRKE